MSDQPTIPPDAPVQVPIPTQTVRKEIPLMAVRNEGDIIAEEMAALFDEDRVSHQHGNSEPEAD